MTLLAKDLQIYVKTSGTCNLNCHHCFTSGNKGQKIFFNPEKTAQFVRQLVESYNIKNTRLLYHGGEPMLAPLEDLTLFYKMTKDCIPNVEYGIQTNLVYKLSDSKLKFFDQVFQGYGLGTSWDSSIRFGSAHPSQAQAQLKLWESNVQLLVRRGFEMTLMVSLSKELINTFQASDVLNYAISLGFKYILFERITVDGHAKVNQDKIRPSNASLDRWLYQMYSDTVKYNFHKKIGNMFLNEIILASTQNLHTANRCRNCEQKLITINPDGSLAGCPNSATESPWGHINQSVDQFVTNKSRVASVCKEKIRNINCYSCELSAICNGDCYKLPWDENLCAAPKSIMREVRLQNIESAKELIF